MTSLCSVLALTLVCEFSQFALDSQREDFWTSNKQLIAFLGTLKHLALEIGNHGLKINILLRWFEESCRNPKVNSLTLCTIPILRALIPKAIFAARTRREVYGYWEILALGWRLLQFNISNYDPSAQGTKDGIQNLVAFSFLSFPFPFFSFSFPFLSFPFLSKLMRIKEMSRTGWKRVGQR